MNKRLLKRIQYIFPDVILDENDFILIYVPNVSDLGLLINPYHSSFKIVKVLHTIGITSPTYVFDHYYFNLFDGTIHLDKGISFEFRCNERKNSDILNNKGLFMSSLRPLLDKLNYNGITVCLTFSCDKRKIYYHYNNNVFWSEYRKKTFSCT